MDIPEVPGPNFHVAQYCHDAEIYELAAKYGITNTTRINRLISSSEVPYCETDLAIYAFQKDHQRRLEAKRLNRARQPRSPYSNSEKKRIMRQFRSLEG